MNETVKEVLEKALSEAEYNLNEAVKSHERAIATEQRTAAHVEKCKREMLDLAGALKDD